MQLPIPLASIAYRAIGAALAIIVMELSAALLNEPMSHIPFVTSIILVMALPKSEPARPRAIIGGHLIAALAGLVVLAAMLPGEIAAAIAVGLATFAMMASDTLHPPAGINAFLIASYGLPLRWIAVPVLAGAVMLALFSRAWAAGEAWALRRAGLTRNEKR
ncbi:MAG: HPP family protein [Proteobacteria bacterium]|nr:HPP family protein [Pseudomonadota bacterium]